MLSTLQDDDDGTETADGGKDDYNSEVHPRMRCVGPFM